MIAESLIPGLTVETRAAIAIDAKHRVRPRVLPGS